jgi:hypothetical protein
MAVAATVQTVQRYRTSHGAMVTVGAVTVNAGGQAVVGVVSAPPRQGASPKSLD